MDPPGDPDHPVPVRDHAGGWGDPGGGPGATEEPPDRQALWHPLSERRNLHQGLNLVLLLSYSTVPNFVTYKIFTKVST